MKTATRPMLSIGEPGKRPPGACLANAATLVALLSLSSHAAGASSEPVIELQRPAASVEVDQVVRWVTESGDNSELPFVIVDKANAQVLVFDAHGHLQGVDAALLGMALGDRSIEGIGERPLSAIPPKDRITPAGRFLATLDHDIHGKEILLIDYADALALHPVIKGQIIERRAQRLASATSTDNRISYGCINVPAKFFDNVVRPAFHHSQGIVYVLPEMSRAMDLYRTTDWRMGDKGLAPANLSDLLVPSATAPAH